MAWHERGWFVAANQVGKTAHATWYFVASFALRIGEERTDSSGLQLDLFIHSVAAVVKKKKKET